MFLVKLFCILEGFLEVDDLRKFLKLLDNLCNFILFRFLDEIDFIRELFSRLVGILIFLEFC